MLGVIPGLVRPDFLIEIEVVAAVPAGKPTGTSNQPWPERRPRDSAPAPGNDHSALQLVMAGFAMAIAQVHWRTIAGWW